MENTIILRSSSVAAFIVRVTFTASLVDLHAQAVAITRISGRVTDNPGSVLVTVTIQTTNLGYRQFAVDGHRFRGRFPIMDLPVGFYDARTSSPNLDPHRSLCGRANRRRQSRRRLRSEGRPDIRDMSSLLSCDLGAVA
jgi:hypothetical protein